MLRLIDLLAPAHTPVAGQPLPEVIRGWLVRHPALGTQAPEMVGALLGRLRQGAGAHAAMRTILDQVLLSQRQRHALAAAVQTSAPAATYDPLAWEPIRSWPLTRLLDTLTHLRPRHAAPPDRAGEAQAGYVLALVFARVGLQARARACLRLQPAQPVVHFLLSQLCRLPHHQPAAWEHVQAAWDGLLAQAPQPQVVHLEVLNRLLTVLGARHQYEYFPPWRATFERFHRDLEPAALTESQRQRLRDVEGECALAQALSLALAPSLTQTTAILEQQLALFAQAMAKGSPCYARARTLPPPPCTTSSIASKPGCPQPWDATPRRWRSQWSRPCGPVIHVGCPVSKSRCSRAIICPRLRTASRHGVALGRRPCLVKR